MEYGKKIKEIFLERREGTDVGKERRRGNGKEKSATPGFFTNLNHITDRVTEVACNRLAEKPKIRLLNIGISCSS